MSTPLIYTNASPKAKKKKDYNKTRKTRAVTASLYPEEIETLKGMCRKRGMTQTGVVRRVIENEWFLSLRPDQIDRLRLAFAAEMGQENAAATN